VHLICMILYIIYKYATISYYFTHFLILYLFLFLFLSLYFCLSVYLCLFTPPSLYVSFALLLSPHNFVLWSSVFLFVSFSLTLHLYLSPSVCPHLSSCLVLAFPRPSLHSLRLPFSLRIYDHCR